MTKSTGSRDESSSKSKKTDDSSKNCQSTHHEKKSVLPTELFQNSYSEERWDSKNE